MTGQRDGANRRVRGVSPQVRLAAQRLRQRLTPAEEALWEKLRMRRLDGLRFRCQHALGPFVLDFYCPEQRLVVEVDGGVHDDPDQAARDAERTLRLASLGYRVVRVRNEEISGDMSGVLARISAATVAGPAALDTGGA